MPEAMKARLRAIQDPKGKSRERWVVAIDYPIKTTSHQSRLIKYGFLLPSLKWARLLSSMTKQAIAISAR